VRHENGLRREGALEVHQYRSGCDIIPQLEAFFTQHIARWSPTPHPSLFLDPAQRAFYRRFCELAGESGWLRFMRLDLKGKPIAFHLGFCYRDQFMWYKPTFDIEWARSSPGEVLLRQLLLAALDEGAKVFDFGLGDEAFKARFATQVDTVRNWGLYPPHVVHGSREAT
jgi:CelD/BcsL family acetyltransferase involved in cellulose biosynthesis